MGGKYSSTKLLVVYIVCHSQAVMAMEQKNDAVVLGSEKKFRCESDTGQRGTFERMARHGVPSRYQPPSGFRFTGVITNVTMSDGGLYRCTLAAQDEQYAYLTVLQSVPTCGRNASNVVLYAYDIVEFSCEVNYTGMYAPVMRWSSNYGIVTMHTNHTVPPSGAIPGYVRYTICVHLRAMSNGAVFKCITYFNQPFSEESPYSGVVPAYVHVYSADPLIVYYPPINLRWYPEKFSYHINESVVFLADANPPATFSYEDISHWDNRLLISSNVLNFSGDFIGEHVYKITAKNSLKGMEQHTIRLARFYVQFERTLVSLWYRLTIASLTVLSAYLVVIGVHYIRVRKRKAEEWWED